MDAVEQFVDESQAAVLLGVEPGRIPALVEDGLLQPLEVEGQRMFHRAEVEALRLQGG